ncbi:solute carrier family 35 member G1-like [Saccoglossus kowalevskii]|uniref:Solute carrier family 35 member G1-like n=1 Tax=Saccoglossus kowalevskii TaxID=10224 RepID=A0ABM0MJN6_SACKO|nr:PREDICTED: solute carrier family 35 member G1-like [Saccoglossus kowalevskii]
MATEEIGGTVPLLDVTNGKGECLAHTNQRKDHAHSHTGVILAFTASGLVSVSFVVSKLVPTVHPFEVVGIRMLLMSICVMPLMLYKNVAFLGSKGITYPWLIVSSLAGSLLVISTFVAINLLPAGNAVVIFSIHPISTAFLSWCILTDSVKWSDFVFGLVSIVGIVAITKPDFLFGHSSYNNTGRSLVGTCVALTAALLTSLLCVGIRKLENRMHTLAVLFYISVSGIVITVTPLYFMDAFSLPASLNEWMYVGVVVICGMLGQVCMITSLQLEKAIYVAIIRTMDIVFAYILEYIWLGNQPEWTGIGGAVLVIISTMSIMGQKIYAEKT